MGNKGKIDEIRFNKKTRHYSWVFERRGIMRKSAGFTHSPEFDNIELIPLPDNPDPTDIDSKTGKTAKSYFNPKMQFQNRADFDNADKTKDGWKMSKENKEKIFGAFGLGKQKRKKKKR